MSKQNNTDLSIGGNIWNVLPTNERQVEILCQKTGISTHLATILSQRNIPYQDVENFLNPKISTLMPNPSILKDMDKASQRRELHRE